MNKISFALLFLSLLLTSFVSADVIEKETQIFVQVDNYTLTIWEPDNSSVLLTFDTKQNKSRQEYNFDTTFNITSANVECGDTVLPENLCGATTLTIPENLCNVNIPADDDTALKECMNKYDSFVQNTINPPTVIKPVEEDSTSVKGWLVLAGIAGVIIVIIFKDKIFPPKHNNREGEQSRDELEATMRSLHQPIQQRQIVHQQPHPVQQPSIDYQQAQYQQYLQQQQYTQQQPIRPQQPVYPLQPVHQQPHPVQQPPPNPVEEDDIFARLKKQYGKKE